MCKSLDKKRIYQNLLEARKRYLERVMILQDGIVV